MYVLQVRTDYVLQVRNLLTMYYKLELTMYYYCWWYDKLWGPSQRVVTLFKSFHWGLKSVNSMSKDNCKNRQELLLQPSWPTE